MNIFFGTDGWRGLLDDEVNERSVSLVAQAFSDYAKTAFPAPTVAIGFDGRRNSRLFARLFASVLKGNGIACHLSDRVIPTPVLSYFVASKQLDFGVMITASHNPPEYNGIKFKASYGGPFSTEETRMVEALIGHSPVLHASDEVTDSDLLSIYTDHLRTIVDFPLIARSSVSVLIDSMSGAGGTLLEELLSHHGCLATTIYGTPAEDFSGRLAEPIERNLLPLREELQRHTYSLGVATDGDADRLGVLLETGEWLSSQGTIVLLADYLKNSKKLTGDIVKTSSVTNLLQSSFGSASCIVHDVQVGFKYICEKMRETDAAFGAEESGGYGFKGHIPERDGILSALIFIEMLASSSYTRLSAYAGAKRRQFGEIFYDRIDHPYLGSDRIEKLPLLEKSPPSHIAQFQVKRINSFQSSRGVTNGLKLILDGNTRWLLLRSSETEPLIRIYAEGESAEEVRLILASGIALVTVPSA
jgi:phosphomannomutase